MIKNTVLITLAVCAGLLLNGCVEDQYAVEKRFWKLKKQAERIFKNPEVSPPNELRRAVDGIDAFVGRYPKNVLALEAKFLAAKLYLAKKDFNNGRQRLEQVIADYKAIKPVCAEAYFLIATSYQLQDNWPKALERFRSVYRDYPLTERGFEAPLYIAMYYKSKFMPEKMVEACEEAVSHFRGLMAGEQNPNVAFRAYNYIGSCYVAMKRWPETISNLRAMDAAFKDKLDTGNLHINIALIYANELKDNARAKETLNAFIRDYPKSRFIKSAQKLLATIEKGKR